MNVRLGLLLYELLDQGVDAVAGKRPEAASGGELNKFFSKDRKQRGG